MAAFKVAVVRGERSISTVLKALKLLGGVQEISGRPVLIKVNFIAVKTWDTGTTTDPLVVEALIKTFQQTDEQVYVVESDATITNAAKAAKVTGVLNLCEKYGVPFLNLRKLKEKVTLPVDSPEVLPQIKVPKLVAESHIVNAAKLKTHSETGVTLGLKNMFGLLPDKLKFKYHLKGIEKVVVDVNTVLKPALTVIDGFVGLKDGGPVKGKPVKMDLIIASKNVTAADATAARIMGFEPERIYHIRRAAEKGLGSLTAIEVVGEPLAELAQDFQRL
ncbi:DUF362 domain-containing protein [Candidatus Hecatella orcuttiae]|jgi:uncharacterized protein (DUF362 family)|uniref:DUF362 domain-containing protein n=1 Tax=Candidatus Hecatella orcuttiae TaxID=1935119 RepID=UPI002867DD37|nr:DUF362 domain-containing protein [Candidatus Hecatella orcuttiae]